MADPYVRAVGQLADMDDIPLTVGVDYDTVTIGRPAGSAGSAWRLTLTQVEELAQLLVAATWEAAQQHARMTAVSDDA